LRENFLTMVVTINLKNHHKIYQLSLVTTLNKSLTIFISSHRSDRTIEY
jgi:hypothetical protein